MSKLFTDAARRQLHIHQRLRRRVSRAVVERIVKVSERASRGVASTGIRGGLDRSTRRRSVVPRLVSFSFSRARPHGHLFRRRSRARVQRSLCFKRERHRHRSRAARFVDVVVVLCARDSSSHRRGETIEAFDFETMRESRVGMNGTKQSRLGLDVLECPKWALRDS